MVPDHSYEIKIMLEITYRCQLADFIATFMDNLTASQPESCTCIWIFKIIWNSLLTSAYLYSLWDFSVYDANYFPALWFPNHNESYYKSKSLQTSNNMPPWDATIKGRTVMGSLWCYQMWWEMHICVWVSPADWSISSPPLNNLKPISSSQMLFKAARLGSNADGISNFKAACFFCLKTSSRFAILLSMRKDITCFYPHH